MAEYDTIPKQLMHLYPQDLIRLALGREDVEIEVEEILDTELPKVETRLVDSLLRVRIDGEEALIHIEFQTSDSANMARRMASYIIRLIEQYDLPVYSFVIYLRPNAGRSDKGFFCQDHADFPVLVRYKVIRLSELDGQGILEGDQAGLLPFAPLMKPPVGMDSEDWLRACVRKGDEVSLDQADKANYLGSLAVLSGLAYDPATINRIFSQEGFMDAIMRESSFAQYLEEQFKEQFLEQGIERGIEQGIERGIEQGIEQGIERGVRERAVEDILDVLEIRFDVVVAGQFAARIATIDDLPRLKRLHRAAVQADDLAAFQRVLDAEA